MNGGIGLNRPVAVRRVQIRVADTAGFDLYQDLALTNLRHGHLIDLQRFLELAHHGRLHRFRHCEPPLCVGVESTLDQIAHRGPTRSWPAKLRSGIVDVQARPQCWRSNSFTWHRDRTNLETGMRYS